MIKEILELLNADNWYGVSENVDIAKGKYKAVSDIKELKQTLKRIRYGRGNLIRINLQSGEAKTKINEVKSYRRFI